MAPKKTFADIRRPDEQNRLNFWSSFNAKPKGQHKFIVRFGDNALFYSGGPEGNYDIDLSAGGFGDLKAIPNLAWVVKSCTRPAWNIPQKSNQYHEADGEFIGYKSLSIEEVTWSPIEIKFVNVTNHTFHPQEMPKDLDFLFSLLIDRSGFRYSRATRTAGISDKGLEPISVESSNKMAFTLRSRQLFEPFEIIDLSTDYVYKEPYTYNDPLGTPVRKDDLNNQTVYPTGKWNLYEPYIMDVRFGSNDYNNDNQFIEYSIRIGYYWAQYTSYAEVGPAVQEYRSTKKSD